MKQGLRKISKGGICYTDSGSALFYSTANDQTFCLYGIASTQPGYCDNGYSVFYDVTYYKSWIDRYTLGWFEGYEAPERSFFVEILITAKNGSSSQCSGTLVALKWVLSAARCFLSSEEVMLFFFLLIVFLFLYLRFSCL